MRGWICLLQFLLAFAIAVILTSKSCGTHDHILLSQIQDPPNLQGQGPVFISPRHWVSFSSSATTRRAVEKIFSFGKNWSPTFLWYNTHCLEDDLANNYSVVACVFVTAGTCLPSCCQATVGGPGTKQGDLMSLLLFLFHNLREVSQKIHLDMHMHEQ
jgi:hypothetical protein